MSTHALLKLTPAEREEIEQALHTGHDARRYRRALGLLHLDDGNSPQEVAEALKVHLSTVYRWVDRFTTSRSVTMLDDRPRPGRPGLLDAISHVEFESILRSSPQAHGIKAHGWTVPLLRTFIRRKHGIRVSDETVRRRLHRQGYRWKRPRHAFTTADPHKGQKKGGSFVPSRAPRKRRSL